MLIAKEVFFWSKMEELYQFSLLETMEARIFRVKLCEKRTFFNSQLF